MSELVVRVGPKTVVPEERCIVCGGELREQEDPRGWWDRRCVDCGTKVRTMAPCRGCGGTEWALTNNPREGPRKVCVRCRNGARAAQQ